jgi:alkanesulfonate monooxygenase SsuD/methylene tetrahydromethanopterin reductase-like flavin-dependent oxidoreductase (luciferase family)
VALRTGVCILPEHPWAEARPVWLEAESAGFAAAWTYDHLSWRTLRNGPWYSPFPLLSAVAAITTRLRLGTLVSSPNFRHPVPLAKELMTLDDLSGGRLDLGIGAGADAEDARVLGRAPWSLGERAARFEEFTDLLDQLLRHPATTRPGRWYAADDARQIPGCVQQPRVPFTVAAAGPRALAVAARHATTWVTYGPWSPSGPAEDLAPDDWIAGVAAQSARLGDVCTAAGRDPGSLARMVLVPLGLAWAQGSPDAWDDFVGRLEEVGLTDVVVHRPRPDDPVIPGPAPATFAHIVSGLTG